MKIDLKAIEEKCDFAIKECNITTLVSVIIHDVPELIARIRELEEQVKEAKEGQK